jgi:nucleoside-diphosphate-sugar epimerase
LPFVLVQDVVQALAAAARVPGVEGKAFNLVGDVRPTAAEYVRLLAESSRRNFRFYPQSLLKMQAVEAGKWMLKVMARKPDNPFPSFRDLKSRSLRASFDCGNAQRVLGWKPNGSLEVFLYEAVASHFKPFLPGDLRLPVSMAS